MVTHSADSDLSGVSLQILLGENLFISFVLTLHQQCGPDVSGPSGHACKMIPFTSDLNHPSFHQLCSSVCGKPGPGSGVSVT